MCGRYANHVYEMYGWKSLLGDWPGGAELSMDIAPSQDIPVVVNSNGTPRSQMMRWGLIPSWSQTNKPKYATFNARLETAQIKPAFRGPCTRRQCCLVPASGYYEWSGEKGNKTRHYIELDEQGPLVMAGLWDHWAQEEKSLYSCTILTRPAIASIADIHPRMPLILNRDDALDWLTKPVSLQLEKLSHYQHYPLRASTYSY